MEAQPQKQSSFRSLWIAIVLNILLNGEIVAHCYTINLHKSKQYIVST